MSEWSDDDLLDSIPPGECQCGCGREIAIIGAFGRRIHFAPGHRMPIRRRKYWKADPDTGCWIWIGPPDSHGYGYVKMPDDYRKPAHRHVYETLVGPVDDGLVLDHLCRNRICVNPEHLEPVTHRENVLRGVGASARNAAKTHCVHGHPYTPENTYINFRGSRECRICRATRAARYAKKGRKS